MDVQIYGLKFTNFLQQHWVRETLPQEIKWHLRANRRKVLKQFTIPSVILLLSFKKLQRHKLFLLIIHFITQSVSPVLRFKIWIFSLYIVLAWKAGTFFGNQIAREPNYCLVRKLDSIFVNWYNRDSRAMLHFFLHDKCRQKISCIWHPVNLSI